MSGKNISVHFVHYEPYEPYPDIIADLGCISDDELNKIMNAFSTRKVAPEACIKSLCLKHSDCTNFGYSFGSNNRYRTLELGNMFDINVMPKCGRQNCELDDDEKIKRCARNLKKGKCRDKFIQKTLGAVLYPQHYGKQK